MWLCGTAYHYLPQLASYGVEHLFLLLLKFLIYL